MRSLWTAIDGALPRFSPEDARAALAVYHELASGGGLAVFPMRYVLAVDGRILFTWCAWDSLFLPEILGSPGEVTSQCPETGRVIRVRIGPGAVERAEPETAVLCFLSPQVATFDRSAANVMTRFCHYVFFLADRDAGEAWTARRPGTSLCSLEDGYALGRRLNAPNFGPALAGREAAVAEEGR